MPREHAVVAQPLTGEQFAPFGFLVEPGRDAPTWVAFGSRTAGVSEAATADAEPLGELWHLGDLTFDADQPYVGYVRYYHQGFAVAQLERHHHETQGWMARDGKGVLVVARSDANGAPDLESTRAFILEPPDFVVIARGIWMCHFLPFAASADFLVITARRTPEQDRDTIDLRVHCDAILTVVHTR